MVQNTVVVNFSFYKVFWHQVGSFMNEIYYISLYYIYRVIILGLPSII